MRVLEGRVRAVDILRVTMPAATHYALVSGVCKPANFHTSIHTSISIHTAVIDVQYIFLYIVFKNIYCRSHPGQRGHRVPRRGCAARATARLGCRGVAVQEGRHHGRAPQGWLPAPHHTKISHTVLHLLSQFLHVLTHSTSLVITFMDIFPSLG